MGSSRQSSPTADTRRGPVNPPTSDGYAAPIGAPADGDGRLVATLALFAVAVAVFLIALVVIAASRA